MPYPTLYAVQSENKEAKLFNCVQVKSNSLSYHFHLLIYLYFNEAPSYDEYCE